MEFKEAIKTRERMCDYYKSCDRCPLEGFPSGCVDGIFEVENTDEYQRILEEWAKEHPVVTNAEKYIEVIKNVFDGDVDKTKIRSVCIKYILGIECNDECTCKECLRWWDEEYKEPEKEKEE